jgi:iron complex outermembrane receptor protein
VELGIRGHSPSGWRWNASYALAETTDHTSLNRNGLVTSTALYARSVPGHVIIVGLGYTIDQWEADLMARWQSSFMDVRGGASLGPLQLVTVNNYLTVNARIGFRVTDNLTLAAVAQQLNEPRLITTGAAPMERRLIASATVRF